MGLYIDSANLKEVKEALSLKVLEGVTTNPTILAREKEKSLPLLQKILKMGPEKIFAQVKYDSVEKMKGEALRLHKLAPEKMIVKIPFSEEGLKLTKILAEEGIRTCLTAIFSVSQGYVGALAGADYLAVYVGRITRNGGDGIDVVKKISEIINMNSLSTRILAASIPSIEDAENLILIDKVDLTAPKKILDEMIKHPLTDKAIEQFNLAKG
jgi:transaldolase